MHTSQGGDDINRGRCALNKGPEGAGRLVELRFRIEHILSRRLRRLTLYDDSDAGGDDESRRTAVHLAICVLQNGL